MTASASTIACSRAASCDFWSPACDSICAFMASTSPANALTSASTLATSAAWASTTPIASRISSSILVIAALSWAIWFWRALYSSFFLTVLSFTFRSSILPLSDWTWVSRDLILSRASWTAFL